jgi:Tfp pilus assembly protein PilF
MVDILSARQLSAELQQGSWGAYEQERLTFLVVSAQVAGDYDLARQALKQLQGSYPHSLSAQVLADKLGPERKEPR